MDCHISTNRFHSFSMWNYHPDAHRKAVSYRNKMIYAGLRDKQLNTQDIKPGFDLLNL